MNYILFGLNHKSAPIEIREKLSLDQSRLAEFLNGFGQTRVGSEIVAVSTCNRVEFYSVAQDLAHYKKSFFDYLKNFFQIHDEKIFTHFYEFTNQQVAQHLFSVTASLDSQVIGENQIVGQVKNAFQISTDLGKTGPFLNRLFQKSFSVAKRIKTQTEIGKGNVSIGSAAVLLAKKIFGTLENRVVLLFGAGEIGELSVRYLNSQKVAKTYIVNRTYERALDLQNQGMGHAKQINEFSNLLEEADVLITSIQGQSEQLSYQNIQKIMQKRSQAPLFIIDLGMPRNIDKSLESIDNVYLYNIDDLKTVTESHQSERIEQMLAAQNMIDEEVSLFYDEFNQNKILPTISQLSRKLETLRQDELQKTLVKLKHLSSEDQLHIEKLTKSLVNKILQEPVISIKKEKQGSQNTTLSVIKKIFSLDDEEQ